MRPLGIALIGCGTVGGGVASILLEHGQRLARRAGRPLQLRRIVVRDTGKQRAAGVPAELVSTDLAGALADPAVDVVVEVAGGVDWARRAVLEALAAGKDVVTANKALLARSGTEVFDAARKAGRAVAFEAAVAGGIPIVAALGQNLAANQIIALQGIVNGTTNFILSSMADRGVGYADALAEAQRLGYAEADPTMDVDGTDAAQKLAILAHLAFGVTVPVSAIARRGIAGLDQADLRYAAELGYTVKLLAEAWLVDRRLALDVSPVLLRHQSPLAQVRGAFNAVRVVGDAVGDTLFYGQGAGALPTASAVVADLIDVATGRTQRTFDALRLWSGDEPGTAIMPGDEVRSRYYLRTYVQDRPGVLADIARVLAVHEISISSVIQHEALEGPEMRTVPLVIMSHTTTTGAFRAAVADVDALPRVASRCVYYPVAD